MKNRVLLTLLAACAVVLAVAQGSTARAADAVTGFYHGKQINLIIFQGPGTTYDVYARLLAKHMGNHIPGKPTFVPQNMVGAGGLKATDYLYRIAPQDGSVMGEISPGNPFAPLLGQAHTDFDPFKFTWIGSMARNTSVGVSWYTTPFKSVEYVKAHEMITPGTGAAADSEIMPTAFNYLVGTKFKVIPGYPGLARAALSLVQGELPGVAYWAWTGIKSSHPDWVRDHKLNIMYQTGTKDIPDLPGVEKIRDYAKSDVDAKALDLLLARQDIGRPFLAPPNVPADRAKALKAAFAATFKDKSFLSDAKKARADVEFVSAEEVAALFKRIASYPPEVIERAKNAIKRVP